MTTKPYKNENKPSDKVSEPIASYANPEKTSIIETYWGLLKNLSTDIKLKLIARLSNSILDDKAKEEYKDLPDKFYGAWEDDKSAEELINEIRNSRVLGTRHIESFE
ncbi:hypothetical protein [Parabacteroides faecis]|uniref:Uncharacterized protein n=1 Tax=Parabacteroides faecis TaxID=1217282 RepID=A0ABR6KR00_9BACT|nr:hypothetical protein [Parabacteroides faecis]MBB4623940.1 hypothetical protein [Parabacteroides faecis]GGK07636.1 hypothetical protein GCM10007084_33510 [Parabacteroides faecis]